MKSKNFLDSIESGEWQSVLNIDAEIKEHQNIAKNSLKKDKRINKPQKSPKTPSVLS